jgi:hypothetical protein
MNLVTKNNKDLNSKGLIYRKIGPMAFLTSKLNALKTHFLPCKSDEIEPSLNTG